MTQALEKLISGNELKPALIDAGIELIPREFLKDAKGCKSVNRAGLSKLDPEKDILLTPAGKRMIRHKNRAFNGVKEYVSNNFEGKLYEELMNMAINRSFMYPRSFYCIDDEKVKVPWLEKPVEVRGVLSHVLSYCKTPIQNKGNLWALLLEKIDVVVSRFPQPLSFSESANSDDWMYKIRTKTNSGAPSWVQTTVKLREKMFKKYKEYVLEIKIEGEIVFTLFYRTQPGKSRAVCGGSELLKVVGAFLTHYLVSLLGPSEGLAWGDVEEVFTPIWNAFKLASSVISLDFKGLDQTISFELHKAALSAVGRQWGMKDTDWNTFMEAYATMVTDNAYLYVVPGNMVKVKNGLLSGEPLTQFTDSIITMAVVELLVDRMEADLRYVQTLGDDVIALLNDEWTSKIIKKFEDFAKDLEKEVGLVINTVKSKAMDLSEKGAFGEFLAHFITEDGWYGNPLRRYHSLFMLERNSAQIKGLSFGATVNDVGYSSAILLRSVQIIGTLTENLPGAEEFIHLASFFEKDLKKVALVRKLVNYWDKMNKEMSGERAMPMQSPHWVVPLLTKL
jgi:hypothetical protein